MTVVVGSVTSLGKRSPLTVVQPVKSSPYAMLTYLTIHSGMIAPIHHYVNGNVQLASDQFLCTKTSNSVTDNAPVPLIKLFLTSRKATMIDFVMSIKTPT